jgi:3-phenylpropionate/cinnamic acid dioxygenase small subunit
VTTTLGDRLAITDLMTRYATAIDSRDWVLLESCFTPDAEVRYPGAPPLHGPEAVARFCEDALSRYRATQHLLGNCSVQVSGDVATTSVSLQATHVTHRSEGGGIFVLGGTYRDRVVREGGEWRIAERTLTTTWTERRPS